MTGAVVHERTCETLIGFSHDSHAYAPTETERFARFRTFRTLASNTPLRARSTHGETAKKRERTEDRMSTGATEARVTPERGAKKSSRVRDAAGRFVVGTAPGPGAPAKDPDLRAACRLRAMSDLERLDVIIAKSRDEWLVLEAIKTRFQYGFGKPVTAHLGGPLVNVNIGAPVPGETMTPEAAYAAMCAGTIEIDPEHPVFTKTAPRLPHACGVREPIDTEAAALPPVNAAPPPAAPDEATATMAAEDATPKALPPDVEAARIAWHAERARGER